MVKKEGDEVVVGDEHNGTEAALNDDLKEVAKEIIETAQRSQHPGALQSTPEEMRRLKKALQDINQSGPNNEGGSLRATLGSFHFRFRKAVYDTLIISASLSAGVIAAIAAPGPGGVALFIAVVDAVDRFQSNITKLDASQLLVYLALAQIQNDKREQGNTNIHVTASEIRDYLRTQPGQGPSLDDISIQLESMREDDVVRGIQTNGQWHYSAIA